MYIIDINIYFYFYENEYRTKVHKCRRKHTYSEWANWYTYALSPIQTKRVSARRRASTLLIKLMLKIGIIHTDRVDARQLICIHRMSDVSLSYT